MKIFVPSMRPFSEHRIAMGKILRCKDAGIDCDSFARGATEEEVLGKAAEHAKKRP